MKPKSKFSIDEQWGGCGLCDKWNGYPDCLLEFERELGLNEKLTSFILRVHRLQRKHRAPTAKALGLDHNAVTRRKKELVDRGLMIDRTGRPHPQNQFKVIPKYDFEPLYERMHQLRRIRTGQALAPVVRVAADGRVSVKPPSLRLMQEAG
jgi:hypothetical protein